MKEWFRVFWFLLTYNPIRFFVSENHNGKEIL